MTKVNTQQNSIEKLSLSDAKPTKVASSWKEHPVVIATTVAVATTVFVVKVMDEVVIPTRTASLTNQIDSLNTEVRNLKDQLANKTAELDSANSSIRAKNSEVRDAQSKLYSAQVGHLFVTGNPYPIGLGLVKIGDSVDRVAEVFSEKSLDKSQAEEGLISVEDQHKVFKRVTYFFNVDAERKVVTHISFHTGNYLHSLNERLVQNKLIEAFGVPRTWSKKDHYSWVVQGQLSILKNDNEGYVLIPNGLYTMSWPKK